MLKKFLALSRSTHGILDVAMPGFVALLWAGGFPTVSVLALSLVTAVAGYTAIYALNDLVGVSVDREKFAGAALPQGYSVEASALRYPLAQGVLSMRSGMVWFAVWYAITLVGAWLLNPPIVLIVIAAALLEVLYCKLLRVTWWRTVVGGLVKSAGPIAAIFVVVPAPSLPLLGLVLAWLICWEIGGQNIPADWNDLEEDRRVGAKTIPLVFGTQRAALVILAALIVTVSLSLFLPVLSPLALGFPFVAAVLVIGFWLLLKPAWDLWLAQVGTGALGAKEVGREAARLFDHASLYPLALLVLMTIVVVFHEFLRS
ncbi:UbiA prenyltransferase [gamma proteobacterium HdN1]|nr:UbiA prenyltransferase [gamma proteobacterium HdN1]